MHFITERTLKPFCHIGCICCTWIFGHYLIADVEHLAVSFGLSEMTFSITIYPSIENGQISNYQDIYCMWNFCALMKHSFSPTNLNPQCVICKGFLEDVLSLLPVFKHLFLLSPLWLSVPMKDAELSWPCWNALCLFYLWKQNIFRCVLFYFLYDRLLCFHLQPLQLPRIFTPIGLLRHRVQ